VVINGRAHRFLLTLLGVMAIESVAFSAKNHDILFINAAIGLEMCDFFNGQGKPDTLNKYLQTPLLSSPPVQPFFVPPP
jgi:hypothetical protein